MRWPLVTRERYEREMAEADFERRRVALELAVCQDELKHAEDMRRGALNEVTILRRQHREMVASLSRAAKEVAGLTAERDHWRSKQAVAAAEETS